MGIDVGGTKRAAVLVDGSGNILAKRWADHEGQWQGRILDTVMTSIGDLLADAGVTLAEVAAIGVAVAGLVSRDRSTLIHSPIIRETGFDLGARLSGATGCPVTVSNDANATLYAIERHDRASERRASGPASVSLLLTLGTGVGGAIMVDDQILVGELGYAAELGHVTVDFADERTCPCGRRGCVEQFVSGRGLEELARLKPPPPVSEALLAALGYQTPFSARGIVAAAERDDPWAADLLTRAGTMLGRAISILCVTLDPSTVTIAGSFGHAAWRWLMPACTREMQDQWTYRAERPLPVLTLDSIGPFAAAYGAALLAAANEEDVTSA